MPDRPLIKGSKRDGINLPPTEVRKERREGGGLMKAEIKRGGVLIGISKHRDQSRCGKINYMERA